MGGDEQNAPCETEGRGRQGCDLAKIRYRRDFKPDHLVWVWQDCPLQGFPPFFIDTCF